MQDFIHCNGGNFRAKLLPKASMYTSNILCLRYAINKSYILNLHMFTTQQMDFLAGNVGNGKSLKITRPRVQGSRAAWHHYLNVDILTSIEILSI